MLSPSILSSLACWFSPLTNRSTVTSCSSSHASAFQVTKRERRQASHGILLYQENTRLFQPCYAADICLDLTDWNWVTGTPTLAPGRLGQWGTGLLHLPLTQPYQKKFPLLFPPFSKQIFCNTSLSGEAMN